MHNKWVTHCKKYSSEHGCSYKEAMTRGRASYKGQKGEGIKDDIINAGHRFIKKHALVSKGLTKLTHKYVPTQYHGIANAVTDVVRQKGYGRWHQGAVHKKN